MRGFNPEIAKKRFANGGMVRGKGTGTSDSIKKDARVGSYIMPADSTEAIGEQTLAGMGKKVPVAVSNGEFEMPPEQVHAIGVQALDQIKNATHTPVARGLPGYTPQNQEPRQFFASGGAVDDMSRWKAASDALRQSNDRIAASQGRVNMQAPDGRFDEAKLAQAANMVQQSRLRMGTQAPVANPDGSMNMQRVAGLSNMVASSRARGFNPQARQYLAGGGLALAPQFAEAPNWTYYDPDFAAKQSAAAMPRSTMPAVDTRPNFTIPPNEPPRASTRFDTSAAQEVSGKSGIKVSNPNTGGAARMSKEAQAFLAQGQRTASAPLAAATPPTTARPAGFVTKARGLMPSSFGKMGRVGGALTAVPEVLNVAEVAGDDNSSGIDVATQAAEGAGRFAAATAGAAGGAQAGAMLGALGGPAAPVTVPLGAFLGGVGGGALGYWGANKAIEGGRAAVGTDTTSPIDKIQPPTTTTPAANSADTPALKADEAAPAPSSNVAPVDTPTTPATTPTARQVGDTGAFEHGRGQYSDNPDGMGFASGFTGRPSAQNMAAMDALAGRSANQISRMAAQQMQPPLMQQQRGFDAPAVQHSGNSWEAANNLRNLRVGMNSMRSTNQSRAAGLAAYKSALDADARARGAENDGAVSAMRENAAIARQGMQEQGANFRDANRNALEAQRIGIAGQEAVFNRGLKGFDVQSAQRKQYIQSLMDAATTPKDRKAIADRFPDVYAGDKEGWKGIELSGGTDALGNKLPSSIGLYNPSTGETRAMGRGAGAGAATPSEFHIKNLKNNPQTAAQFDAAFGAGSAAAILGKP